MAELANYTSSGAEINPTAGQKISAYVKNNQKDLQDDVKSIDVPYSNSKWKNMWEEGAKGAAEGAIIDTATGWKDFGAGTIIKGLLGMWNGWHKKDPYAEQKAAIERMNEYNTPKNQRKRLEEAGYNPMLYADQANPGLQSGIGSYQSSAQQENTQQDTSNKKSEQKHIQQDIENMIQVIEESKSKVSNNRAQEALNRFEVNYKQNLLHLQEISQKLERKKISQKDAEIELSRIRTNFDKAYKEWEENSVHLGVLGKFQTAKLEKAIKKGTEAAKKMAGGNSNERSGSYTGNGAADRLMERKGHLRQ